MKMKEQKRRLKGLVERREGGKSRAIAHGVPGGPRMWLSMGTDAAFDGHECGF